MRHGVYVKKNPSGKGKGTGVGKLYQFVTIARDHYGKGPDLVAYTPLRIEPEWAGTLRVAYIPRTDFERMFEFLSEGLPDDLTPYL